MLDKCANPECHRRFRYLYEGRLYCMSRERQPDAELRANGGGRVAYHDSASEFYWLCESCSRLLTLATEPDGKLVLAPSARPEGTWHGWRKRIA